MAFWSMLPALFGAHFASRAPVQIAHASTTGQLWQATKGFFPSGQFGIGYTGGAYLGYGLSNTWDPLSLHKKHYKQPKHVKFRMPYGYYGRRYGRFRRYRRYRRRSYYRRRFY